MSEFSRWLDYFYCCSAVLLFCWLFRCFFCTSAPVQWLYSLSFFLSQTPQNASLVSESRAACSQKARETSKCAMRIVSGENAGALLAPCRHDNVVLASIAWKTIFSRQKPIRSSDENPRMKLSKLSDIVDGRLCYQIGRAVL